MDRCQTVDPNTATQVDQVINVFTYELVMCITSITYIKCTGFGWWQGCYSLKLTLTAADESVWILLLYTRLCHLMHCKDPL